MVDFEFLDKRKKASTFAKSSQNMNKNNKYKFYDSYIGGKNMWLIKPTSYNRGRGIRIFNDIETLVGYLKDFSDGVEESKILSKESIQKDEVIDEPIT